MAGRHRPLTQESAREGRGGDRRPPLPAGRGGGGPGGGRRPPAPGGRGGGGAGRGTLALLVAEGDCRGKPPPQQPGKILSRVRSSRKRGRVVHGASARRGGL